ncbi:MAG: hypothetical protein JWM89_900 [Acidimicrobiales bacterium]|nr:hypothetical protein [Acidimicrobiales bacterium]
MILLHCLRQQPHRVLISLSSVTFFCVLVIVALVQGDIAHAGAWMVGVAIFSLSLLMDIRVIRTQKRNAAQRRWR